MDNYSELVGETPQFSRGTQVELTSLGGPTAEFTTGLILTWRDQLVFGIEPNVRPLGARGIKDAAAFVGVGGHLNPGEGWSDAVTREAMEEANCQISLADSAVTYFCHEDHLPHPITYPWEETCRPLLIWAATFPLRRGPNRERIPTTLVCSVFRAAALNEPKPGSELDTLLIIDRETLQHTYMTPCSIDELLTQGAQIIGHPPSQDMILAPGGSAYFFAQWLAWQN
jgi:8-oxo-dGTP pyrophosphatase MutT (NUDIX family)